MAFSHPREDRPVKIKSNDRMIRSKTHVDRMMKAIETWPSPHRNQALAFARRLSPPNLFELLHAIRRWYSGQTMARLIRKHRPALSHAMELSPRAVVGVWRGFKVPLNHPLARVEEGTKLRLRVVRNHGFSSWSATEAPVHRFSGKSPGKIGLVVRLVHPGSAVPVLAPPKRTSAWFNALYERVIGRSFRPTEDEYLMTGSPIMVRVVRVKR